MRKLRHFHHSMVFPLLFLVSNVQPRVINPLMQESQLNNHAEPLQDTLAIPRICAAHLTPELFQSQYLLPNRPVIIENVLNSSALYDWSPAKLNEILGDRVLKNVFSSKTGRFTFFKASEAKTSGEDNDLQRNSMKFSEFLQKAKEKLDQSAENSENHSSVYVYGEPVPAELINYFPTPEFLAVQNVDSRLLWISVCNSLSPLHFDLSEGLLLQLQGAKKITLFDSKFYEELYPYPLQHQHDRQSQINDINQPNLRQFPRFQREKIPCFTGVIEKNECLYIPYSWWHELSTETNLNKPSVSVSYRFNPYQQKLQVAALSQHKFLNCGLPISAISAMMEGLLSDLPLAVQTAFLRRANLPVSRVPREGRRENEEGSAGR
jgi:hypothetical protein